MTSLKADLKAAQAERKRLEEGDVERAKAKKKLIQLEEETEACRAEEHRLKAQLEAEGQKRTALAKTEQQRGRWVDPAKTEPMDAEQQNKAVQTIKHRRDRLTKLLATIKAPSATVKEEDALRQLDSELKKLEKAQVILLRELHQVNKTVDAERREVSLKKGNIEGNVEGEDAEQREAKEEEYVRKLEEMANKLKPQRDKAESAHKELKEAWDGWFETLQTAARKLQARSDAGESDAVRLPDGEQQTPAFKVLEVLREISQRHADLKKRASELSGQEAALNAKLESCKGKIVGQGAALQLEKRLEGMRKARVEAAIAAERRGPLPESWEGVTLPALS